MKKVIYANRYYENGEHIGNNYGCTGTGHAGKGINLTALSLLAEEIKNQLQLSEEVYENLQTTEIIARRKENSKLTVIIRTGLNLDELIGLSRRLSKDDSI